jgi:16S rRNA (guanine527-N7)-methyltransferase
VSGPVAGDEPLVRALAKARALGFLGPGPVEAHIDHALAFLRLIDEPAGRGLDLGSGGGVPGLVLAWRLPGWTWVLVDASRRRTSFLAATVAELDLGGRVAVERARAELLAHDADHRLAYDVVTARSFAPPPVTAEVGGAFVRIEGRLLVADPPGPSARWDPATLSRLGLQDRGGPTDPALRVLVRTGPLVPELPRPTAFRKPLA